MKSLGLAFMSLLMLSTFSFAGGSREKIPEKEASIDEQAFDQIYTKLMKLDSEHGCGLKNLNMSITVNGTLKAPSYFYFAGELITEVYDSHILEKLGISYNSVIESTKDECQMKAGDLRMLPGNYDFLIAIHDLGNDYLDGDNSLIEPVNMKVIFTDKSVDEVRNLNANAEVKEDKNGKNTVVFYSKVDIRTGVSTVMNMRIILDSLQK